MNIILFTLVMQTALILISGVAFAQGGTEGEDLEFRANLTGQAVVLPPVVTNASGEATFVLSEDGDEMAFELQTQDIEGVVNAHMHVGNSTINSPALVTLYNIQTSDLPNGSDGSLASGEFTSEDFERSYPRAQNITSLLDLIEEGKIYVDVHTLTYPRGELRGTVLQAQQEANIEQ